MTLGTQDDKWAGWERDHEEKAAGVGFAAALLVRVLAEAR